MTRQTQPEILRELAAAYEAHGVANSTEFSCIAIDRAVLKPGEIVKSPLRRRYSAVFELHTEPYNEDELWDIEALDPQGAAELRAMMLCFMAELIEQGDA